MRLIDADKLREGIRRLHEYYGADDTSRNAICRVEGIVISMMQSQPSPVGHVAQSKVLDQNIGGIPKQPNKLDEMIKHIAFSDIQDAMHEINRQLKELRGERD